MNIYINQYKLSKDDSEVLLSNKSLAKFFDKTLDFIKDPMITSKWIITEIIKYIGLDTFNLKEENFAKFLQAVKEGKINNNSGKELLENLVVSNEDVDVLIDSLDLKQESSEDLLNEVIDKVLENNPDEKKRLLDGELKLLSFFMGQVMRETKGKGNPTVVGDIIRKRFNLS
jgi:aspartyl-tRNA(Asn)/glutamyl-tRNA(Gln) amidotransferase subunit B